MSNKQPSAFHGGSHKPHCADVSMGFAVGAAVVVLLRLVIWKFLPGADTLVKEDLSNLIVAALQLGGGAAFACFALAGRVRLAPTGFEWPLGLMLAASSLSLLYTLDFSLSIRVWLPLVGSLAMFYVLANSLTDLRKIKWFLYFILGCALVSSIFGIKEFFVLSARQAQPGDASIAQYNNSLYYIILSRRVTSFLGWPNSLAGYLTLILPFALLSVLLVRKIWQRVLLAGTIVVLVGCLLVTFSFLGWLSFLLATVLMLPVLMSRFLPKMDARLKVLAFLLAGAFIALFVIVVLRKDFASSLSPRMAYYSQAWQLLVLHPLEGYGYGTFGVAARPLVTSASGITNFAHNSYLQWWVECGFLGFAGILCFVGILFTAARRMLERFKEGDASLIVLAVVWGLAVFVIDNLFSFTLVKPNIAVHGWAMLGVFAALCQPVVSGAKSPAVRPVPSIMAILLCGGALALAGLLCCGLLFYHAGMMAYRAGNIDAAGRAFVQGSLIDRWSASYPLSTGEAAIAVYRHSRKVQHLRLAEENYLEALRREPGQYAPYFMLSRVYLALGEQGQAVTYAREARRLSPYEYERDMGIIAQNAAAKQRP
ncbi:MAG: O-antigen ligase family protein [Candidatus Omnitrophica bacterium]|nr:O-antigen ligase family protein [Candidatus Omnitrophota bacterium]